MWLLSGWRPCAWWTWRTTSRHGTTFIPPARIVRSQCKPPWVRRELIRLKALSPELGCRTLAEVFNRRFAHRHVRVGKSFVATVLRQSKAEVTRLRRTLKHRVPRPVSRNRIWALDLTGKDDISSRQHMMLGLLDHGSRARLRLTALPDKRSITLLRELIAAFRQFGVPRCIRVDNEACLNSRLMKSALALLGITLQTTEPHCPWQNGRIERFFGTLKRHLDRIAVVDGGDLRHKLIEFRCWYNHARPHQHLDGHRPAEAWSGKHKSTRCPKFVSIWNGAITGWWFPP